MGRGGRDAYSSKPDIGYFYPRRELEEGKERKKEATNIESSSDYDSDEGFEISEATPDDDTAALDAKIDKLKGELISDTKNLESYLNRIL